MNSSQTQHELIEHIVREVLSRLRGDAKSPVTETSKSVSITDRVVTWKKIEDKVAGASSVQVQPGAIVTPLVRDELRQRNIAIVVGECKPQSSPTCDIAIAELNESASVVGNLDATKFNNIEQWSRSLRSNVKSVLMTNKPTLAACIANRNASVRAMEGRCPTSLQEGIAELTPTVLTINPNGKSEAEIRELIAIFT